MSKNITIPVPAVPFAPPVYTCHRAKKEFHLDGNINKPFWEDAPYTDEFLDIQGSHMPLPRFVTRAKMLWDDENLYVAADLAADDSDEVALIQLQVLSSTLTTISRSSLTRIPIRTITMNLK